jgi:excisionase family DNA binding protein
MITVPAGIRALVAPSRWTSAAVPTASPRWCASNSSTIRSRGRFTSSDRGGGSAFHIASQNENGMQNVGSWADRLKILAWDGSGLLLFWGRRSALRRVRDLEERRPTATRSEIEVDPNAFANLAENLSEAWNAQGVTMRARQRLLRALIVDIIVDVDEKARDVVLTVHWRGGQHSELRARKPRAGEHGCATTEDALAVMRSMAGRWSDEHIAASLNRMGLPTGQGKTWTAHRVSSVRRVRGIHAYRSAEKDGEWLTLTEAAAALRVTSHMIRRLIKSGVLPAVQVVPGAPYQIRACDLASESVKSAMARKGRPCRITDDNTIPMFTDT